MRTGALAALAMSLAGPAHAATGNDLYKWMTAPDEPTQTIAVAFVAGLADGLSFARYLSNETRIDLPPGYVCFPANTINQQVYDVIKAHLAANPAQRQQDAGALSVLALRNAWPCK